MHMSFTKMQGLGNDFVVIDAITQSIVMTPELAKTMCDRHYGIGCDQILLVTQTQNKNADFGYQIFNADGSEAFQCGNGARCVGLFIQQKKLSDKKKLRLETKNNHILTLSIQNDHQIAVGMGKANFDPLSLPFITEQKAAPYNLLIEHKEIIFDVVSIGNPHAIITTKELNLIEIENIGKKISMHPAFPDSVNVGFMKIVSPNEITLAVYERGAGMTQACGSGATAAVAIGHKKKILGENVMVNQIGGSLYVRCSEKELFLTGPAKFVFEGIF